MSNSGLYRKAVTDSVNLVYLDLDLASYVTNDPQILDQMAFTCFDQDNNRRL